LIAPTLVGHEILSCEIIYSYDEPESKQPCEDLKMFAKMTGIEQPVKFECALHMTARMENFMDHFITAETCSCPMPIETIRFILQSNNSGGLLLTAIKRLPRNRIISPEERENLFVRFKRYRCHDTHSNVSITFLKSRF